MRSVLLSGTRRGDVLIVLLGSYPARLSIVYGMKDTHWKLLTYSISNSVYLPIDKVLLQRREYGVLLH